MNYKPPELDTKNKLIEAISHLSLMEANAYRMDFGTTEYDCTALMMDIQQVKNMLIMIGMEREEEK